MKAAVWCFVLALAFAGVPAFLGAPPAGGHTFVAAILAIAAVVISTRDEQVEEQ